MRVCVVTPFLNEANNLPVYREQLTSVLKQLDIEYEVILVDDHSSDDGVRIAKEWAMQDPNVKYIRLSRSSGSHTAISAGLAKCRSDCAVVMAADLQDPPEAIFSLVEKWKEGFDVVWAERSARPGESLLTIALARIYYILMRRVALKNMPSRGADFLLMDRKVIDAFNISVEKNTSCLAMILWLGFRQTSIEYVKQARYSGKSKWTFSAKLKLLLDSVLSFSYVPIRMMSALGISISFSGFVFALHVLMNTIAGNPVEGWSSLMVVVLLIGGIQLIMLGVLGEYVWRSYDEVRGRPRYVIEEMISGRESKSDKKEFSAKLVASEGK